MSQTRLLKRLYLLAFSLIFFSGQMHAFIPWVPESYVGGITIKDYDPTGKGTVYVSDYDPLFYEEGDIYYWKSTTDKGGDLNFTVGSNDVIKGWAISRFSDGTLNGSTLTVKAPTDDKKEAKYDLTVYWKAMLYDNPENNNYVAYSDEKAGFAGSACDVDMDRRLSSNYYNPVCLPFIYAPPSDWEVFKYVGEDVTSDAITLKFERNVGPMVAGTPYLVKPGSTVTTIAVKNIYLTGTANSSNGQYYDFVGNFDPVTVNAGDVYISTSSETPLKISNNENGFTLKPYRAYLRKKSSAAGAKSLSISFDVDGQATPIEDIPLDEGPDNAAIYDLNGRRLNEKPAHGIYIQNGKKYFAK